MIMTMTTIMTMTKTTIMETVADRFTLGRVSLARASECWPS
jgi:hypothetical protein